MPENFKRPTCQTCLFSQHAGDDTEDGAYRCCFAHDTRELKSAADFCGQGAWSPMDLGLDNVPRETAALGYLPALLNVMARIEDSKSKIQVVRNMPVQVGPQH